MQVPVVQQLHDVVDVDVEVDAGDSEVRPLGQTGERRGEHLVARRLSRRFTFA